jgi:hypothetical protein
LGTWIGLGFNNHQEYVLFISQDNWILNLYINGTSSGSSPSSYTYTRNILTLNFDDYENVNITSVLYENILTLVAGGESFNLTRLSIPSSTLDINHFVGTWTWSMILSDLRAGMELNITDNVWILRNYHSVFGDDLYGGQYTYINNIASLKINEDEYLTAIVFEGLLILKDEDDSWIFRR